MTEEDEFILEPVFSILHFWKTRTILLELRIKPLAL